MSPTSHRERRDSERDWRSVPTGLGVGYIAIILVGGVALVVDGWMWGLLLLAVIPLLVYGILKGRA